MGPRRYYVCMMTNKSGTLYAGFTNDIARRVYQHRQKLTPGFTSKYNISRLIWMEEFGSPTEAIAREKQIKGWTRAKKLALIRATNPQFRELSLDELPS